MTGSRGCRNGLLAAACLLVFLAGCASTPAQEVVAIGKTKMYHRESCAPVQMAKGEKMTAAEAKAMGFRPCPVCKPDSEQ